MSHVFKSQAYTSLLACRPMSTSKPRVPRRTPARAPIARCGLRRATTALALLTGLALLLAGTAGAASSAVYLNQPRISQGVRPPALQFGEPRSPAIKAVASVSGLSWSSWGGATAEGNGQALIQWPDARATVPVVARASGLKSCGGIDVYTSLVISPAPGATVPPYFAQVQNDREVLPCTVHGGNYVAGREERTDPDGCFFSGLSEAELFRSVGTFPSGIGYCAMRWKDWGSGTTTGIGVARKGEQQYGLRVRLSQSRSSKH
jgi:hypothetical protein